MSLAIVSSLAQVGISAPEVTVEVHISRGLPAFSMVGLPETAVRESRDRVRGAILNSGFEFPNCRITVNLAPADLPKEGGRFDLPIALGILAAAGQIPGVQLGQYVFLGELALDGTLRYVPGVLVAAMTLRGTGKILCVPGCSVAQGSVVNGARVAGVANLLELSRLLIAGQTPQETPFQPASGTPNYPDMGDVAANHFPKQALEIAACGGHSMLMLGSPGCGKTMLAQRLPGLLPEMSDDEALETGAITSSVDSNWDHRNWKTRPFRAPHHSASTAALIGGGSIPRPGEISRAHHGVLFLDELTEFEARTIDSLREPMESGYINISRAAIQLRFPCRFTFIAAANPCKCGYYGDPSGRCECTPEQVLRYMSRLSGPLLDRLDIQVRVNSLSYQELDNKQAEEPSAVIRQRVIACRQRQLARQGKLNSELAQEGIARWCRLDKDAAMLIEQVYDHLGLSVRGYHRILKLARTIADRAGNDNIGRPHVAMATKLRCLDRSPSRYASSD